MNDNQHAMTGAWALDALDAEERAMVEAYLAEDPEAAAEAEGFAETTVELAEGLDPEAPRPELKSAVMHRISRTRQLPPGAAQHGPTHRDDSATTDTRPDGPDSGAATAVGTSPTAPAEPDSTDRYRRSLRRSRLFALAAGVLLATTVAGMGLWSGERTAREQAQQTIEALQGSPTGVDPEQAAWQRIVASDDTAHAELASATGGALEVVSSRQAGSMIVTASDLDAPPDGSVYQLWLIDEDGTPQPSQLIEGSAGTVVIDQDLDEVTQVAMTMEPAGGSEQPTSDILANGELT